MKTKMSLYLSVLSLLSISTFSAPSASAAPQSGDRAYSNVPVTFTHPANSTKNYVHYTENPLGAGTIKTVFADGTAEFVSDARFPLSSTTRILTKEQVKALMPKVSCPEIESDRKVYSNARVLKSRGTALVEYYAGILTIKESFGNCKTGVATILTNDPDINLDETRFPGRTVKMTSLQKPVTCPYSNKRSRSTDSFDVFDQKNNRWNSYVQGFGVAKQVYGSCKDGIVAFRGDRNTGENVLVPASSIVEIASPVASNADGASAKTAN